jgi:hypothetical protein
MFPTLLIPIIVIVFVTLVALLTLAVPLEFSLSAKCFGKKVALSALVSWSVFRVKIVYAAGKIDIELLLFQKKVYRKSVEPSLTPEIKIDYSEIHAAMSRINSIRAVWPGILRVLNAMKRQTRFRRLSYDFVFGTGSPAATGLVFGIFSAIRPTLMASDRISMSLRPVFDREVVEGTIQLEMHLERPLIVMVLLVRLFLYPETRQSVHNTRFWKGAADV